jgi:hypothetical protein
MPKITFNLNFLLDSKTPQYLLSLTQRTKQFITEMLAVWNYGSLNIFFGTHQDNNCKEYTARQSSG